MTSRPWAWLAALITFSCASPQQKSDPDVAVVRHVDKTAGGSATVPLAGARCKGRNSCTCRVGNEAETDPPAEGMKRLEIRLAADGGAAAMQGGLGHFESVG